ncbi:MAG: L,D-transpeptidase family protein [Clostridiales bacterium]|nr:L,D-transpeptidase family protein [Clostridiales bacterium]
MRRSLRLFLLAVMVLAVFFSLSARTGADQNIKAASQTDVNDNRPDYTVENGDSLYPAVSDDGATVDGLKEYNDLEDEIKILINKTGQKLTVYKGDTEIQVYKAHFGEGGMEDKEIQGDRKTPEGTFYITEKSILTPTDEYLGSRWMRLSYPSIEDGDRGLEWGIIDQATRDSIAWAINNKETPPQRTALGGGIGIHGGDIPEFGDNWTWGCIGLTNMDAEELFELVSVGTQVIITR